MVHVADVDWSWGENKFVTEMFLKLVEKKGVANFLLILPSKSVSIMMQFLLCILRDLFIYLRVKWLSYKICNSFSYLLTLSVDVWKYNSCKNRNQHKSMLDIRNNVIIIIKLCVMHFISWWLLVKTKIIRYVLLIIM